jgi:hypothetical protein
MSEGISSPFPAPARRRRPYRRPPRPPPPRPAPPARLRADTSELSPAGAALAPEARPACALPVPDHPLGVFFCQLPFWPWRYTFPERSAYTLFGCADEPGVRRAVPCADGALRAAFAGRS